MTCSVCSVTNIKILRGGRQRGKSIQKRGERELIFCMPETAMNRVCNNALKNIHVVCDKNRGIDWIAWLISLGLPKLAKGIDHESPCKPHILY